MLRDGVFNFRGVVISDVYAKAANPPNPFRSCVAGNGRTIRDFPGCRGRLNDTGRSRYRPRPYRNGRRDRVAIQPRHRAVKGSLDTTQPQTIINKSYIEDSVAQTADYVTLLAIVPSLTGLSINGPGLSDGNVKNTLRGMPDGNFGMSYDGIPFGDTNGPTHHSESYFPASTIGSVDVDRGPGNAGTLGASTFGGTINLFSETLTDDFHAKQTATYGSWDTWNVNTNFQTGNFNADGHTTHAFLRTSRIRSPHGYLTLQSTHHDNELVKVETDIAPNWTLTAFANRNGLVRRQRQ